MGEDTIDGFAGPGGWDIAARRLGLDPLGIEIDPSACATREAAGLRTLRADVSQLDPLEFAPVQRAIFSPPCPSFSMAGRGQGRDAIPLYCEAMHRMAFERKSVDRVELDSMCEDERAHLILEPLRWVLALRPRWVACENVEPCLPLWETMALCLRHVGYRAWAGVLSSERYGVPQTRKRAILMASLDRQPGEPPASHARYVPPRVKAKQEESLFAAPEPERIVLPEDRELLPWVSMAEALGWGMTARPYPVVACSSETGGPDLEKVGGSGARAAIYEEQAAGRWEGGFEDYGQATPNGSRRDGRWLRANAQPNAAVRSADESAPTIKGGHDTADRVWEDVSDAPTHMNTGRDWKSGGSREDAQKIPTSEPSPTITAKLGGQAHWTDERPATTVAGDPRVFPPGHKLNADDLAAGRGGQQRSGAGWTDERPATTQQGDPRIFPPGHFHRNDDGPADENAGPNGKAVRVAVSEAAVLQGFPPDYPWQGTRTAQYRQVGDAVPPGLALAVLAELERP